MLIKWWWCWQWWWLSWHPWQMTFWLLLKTSPLTEGSSSQSTAFHLWEGCQTYLLIRIHALSTYIIYLLYAPTENTQNSSTFNTHTYILVSSLFLDKTFLFPSFLFVRHSPHILIILSWVCTNFFSLSFKDWCSELNALNIV